MWKAREIWINSSGHFRLEYNHSYSGFEQPSFPWIKFLASNDCGCEFSALSLNEISFGNTLNSSDLVGTIDLSGTSFFNRKEKIEFP